MPRFEDENLTRHIEVQKLTSYITLWLTLTFGEQPGSGHSTCGRDDMEINEVAWQVLRGKDIHEGCDR